MLSINYKPTNVINASKVIGFDIPTLPPSSSDTKKLKRYLLYEGKNVIYNSVAGAGKTTTALDIANEIRYNNLEKNILLLVYNDKLRKETETRINTHNLQKVITAHTIHSFCYNMFKEKKCYTDEGLLQITENLPMYMSKLHDCRTYYDYIIVDESQDVDKVLFSAIISIIKAFAHKNTRMCVFGDKRQCIYEYKNSDPRYLVLAGNIYPVSGEWVEISVNITYRVPRVICEFINALSDDDHTPLKSNPKRIEDSGLISVHTYRKATGNIPHIVINNNQIFDYFIKEYINKYGPGNIFIISPYIGDNSTLKQMENIISSISDKLAVYYPSSDEEKLSDKQTRNKITFSTIHQSKGLERDLVIFVNFNEKMLSKFGETNTLTNLMYVAFTRAKKELVILCEDGEALPEIVYKRRDNPLISSLFTKIIFHGGSTSKSNHQSVTKLVRHITQENYTRLRNSGLIRATCIEEASSNPIIITSEIVNSNKDSESIAVINGVLSAVMYEYKRYKRSVVLDKLYCYMADFVKEQRGIHHKCYAKKCYCDDGLNSLRNRIYRERLARILDFDDVSTIVSILLKYTAPMKFSNITSELTVKEMTIMCIYYLSITDSTLFRIKQIIKKTNCDWMEQYVSKIHASMDKLELVNPVFEIPYITKVTKDADMSNIHGIIDCKDGMNIYEFKTVRELKNEYFLQVFVYMYLVMTNDPSRASMYNFYLYNILSGEKWIFSSTLEEITQFMHLLIDIKMNKEKNEIKDDEFISTNRNIVQKLLSIVFN